MLERILFTTTKDLHYRNIDIELCIDFEKTWKHSELKFRFYFSECSIIYTTFRLDKLKILEIVDMVELLKNTLKNIELEKNKIVRININNNYQIHRKIINDHNRILIHFRFIYYGFIDTIIFIAFEKKVSKNLLLNTFNFIIKKMPKIFENIKEQIKETIIDELNITFSHSPF